MPAPFLSICIPAYKNVDFLKRLLQSIAVQTFTDFEVVITDDSNDESVAALIRDYQSQFELHYIKNQTALGSPQNWNEGIKHARGAWIKIMHDDDWFYNEHSLQEWADQIKAHPDIDFFFSAYTNVYEGGRKEAVRLKLRNIYFLKDPLRLLSENVIGPPSATIYRNKPGFLFDPALKWLVDIDFYIRYLKQSSYFYINKELVNIGISNLQVTKSSFRVATVEIPEHFHVLQKMGVHHLNKLVLFDTFWRLIRNLGISSEEDIRKAGYSGEIPSKIKKMIKWQQGPVKKIIQFGPASKVVMFLCAVSGW
jgi:glycosyltransferase involved in cell wall biosynthesis